MASIRHQEWRDEIESTNYPFGDKALLVNQAGDTLLVAKGGKGGWGNQKFKSSTNRAPRKVMPGLPG